jgi:hypothetical protein
MRSRTIRAATVVGVALIASTTLVAAPPSPGAATEASAAIIGSRFPVADVTLRELVWPTTTAADVQSFAYPDNGSIVTTALRVPASRRRPARWPCHRPPPRRSP